MLYDSLMMRVSEKKERERRLIEGARRRSSCFPSGELTPYEKPDWLIPAASLGIEVTELLPQKDDDARFSGPQLSSFQKQVVGTAEECYCSRGDAPPADVLVFFKNDWTRKRDLNDMGQALATLVLANYPSNQETVVLQDLDIPDWVDGFSVVRISRGQGVWQAGGASGIPLLTYEDLAGCIAGKNQKVQVYKKRLPGWQVWLLLATRISVLSSVIIPREMTSWRFEFDFDKVLLSPWDGRVIELQRGG